MTVNDYVAQKLHEERACHAAVLAHNPGDNIWWTDGHFECSHLTSFTPQLF